MRSLRRREGRYLLRINLRGREPAELWRFYIQLTEVEAAFKTLKDDLPEISQGDRPPPPETLLRLPQRQNAAVRRQQPPSNLATTALPSTGDKPASGNYRIGHGGCGLAEIARIGFDNQILHEIRYLRHIRQPAMNNAGQRSEAVN